MRKGLKVFQSCFFLYQNLIIFTGINHYTSSLAYPDSKNYNGKDGIGWFFDSDTLEYQDPKWYSAASNWLKVTPFGMRRLMNWLKRNYGSIPIYITENGFSDYLGNLDDMHRIYYLKHYINQLLKGF